MDSRDSSGTRVRLAELPQDLIVMINASSPAEVASAANVVARALARHTAPELTVRCTGEQFVVSPGDHHPIVAMFAFRRRPELTRASAQRHWRDKHALIGYRFPGNRGSGYRQFHPPTDADGITGPGPFDGITTGHYPSIEFMRAGREHPEYAREAFEDVSRFAEYSKSSNVVFADAARLSD